MISAKRSVIEFDRKFDRFVGETNRRLKLEDKLALLNEALEIYTENQMKIAEVNSEVRVNLRVLENKEVELKVVKRTANYSIYKLPENCLKMLRQRAIISKEGCGEKEIPLIIFQTDDLDDARNNPYWRSSYQWEHALADEGNNGLYVWHEGDFKIESVLIDYYRKPKEIHAPSMTTRNEYEDWNGIVQTKDQGLELDRGYSHRRITDIAVLLARAEIGDVGDFQLQLNKILNVEKLN